MHDLNWWLMTLAFLVGLVITFALMIRKVTREVPVSHTVSAAVGAAAGGAAGGAAKLVGDALERDPYGPGSVRVAAGSAAPAGHTIKGNEDSMLYHTTDSPWYGQTVAEIWFAEEDSAQRAGFTRWDANQGGRFSIASIDEVPAGPYGKGSATPGSDGSGPIGWAIKGNADSMLYHPVDSPAYEVTIAEVWFFDEATARAAGFDKWDKNLG